MANFKIPYSTGFMDINIEDARIAAVLLPRKPAEEKNLSQDDIILQALENPIDSPRLSELVKDKKRLLLITSDHTRPLPSKLTLPRILDEARSINKDIEIKILIATGFHRLTTKEEMIYKFGAEIVNNEVIINHDSRDMSNMVFKGIMPSGGELWLNSLVDWADIIVSEGFIEPHFFAGFSGGRKSILPGIASEKTIFANHCAKFIDDPDAIAGSIQNNPAHRDMIFAAEKAGLSFIFNVVIDDDKKIIKAFSGHFQKAHMAGCAFVSDMSKVKAVKADIVVTSNGGYPLDQNIYQSVKGMTSASRSVTEKGVIIIISACVDGHGGDHFYRFFIKEDSPHCVLKNICCVPQHETTADQWEAQLLAKVLAKNKVIVVSDKCDPQTVTDMHMLHAHDFETAMKLAEGIVGENSSVTIIPDGVAVIVE